MQRIRLTPALLTELARCDRAFVLELLWHGIDNESLRQKGGLEADSSEIREARRQLSYNLTSIAQSVEKAIDGIHTIDCTSCDVQEKIDRTWDAVTSGDLCVIAEGALAGENYIVPFGILITTEDGWEVYHQSTKSYDENMTRGEKNKILADAAPLAYLCMNEYKDYIKRFAILAANKNYVTPYPDTNWQMTINPNEAILCWDLDIEDMNEEMWKDFLGYEDPMEKVYQLQNELSQNPFWIPDCELGAHCNTPYECPFKEYCTREKRGENPNDVYFYLPANDVNACRKKDINTMDELLEYSYENPRMEEWKTTRHKIRDEVDFHKWKDYPDFQLEYTWWEPGQEWSSEMTGDECTVKELDWHLSDEAMRELRSYELALLEVEKNVQDLLY